MSLWAQHRCLFQVKCLQRVQRIPCGEQEDETSSGWTRGRKTFFTTLKLLRCSSVFIPGSKKVCLKEKNRRQRKVCRWKGALTFFLTNIFPMDLWNLEKAHQPQLADLAGALCASSCSKAWERSRGCEFDIYLFICFWRGNGEMDNALACCAGIPGSIPAIGIDAIFR